jgi:hypothetical protein
MECFDEVIGIKSGCEITPSSSGLYIEDIAITCKEADDYINAEYETGQALIEDKISFAGKVIGKSVKNYFQSQINTRQFLDSKILGTNQDNLVLMNAVSGNYGGLSLALANQSSYLDVFINELSLQVNYTGSIDVKVYNLVTGALLDTISVDCIAGEISTKVVNKSYASNRKKLDLIFVYDVDSIQSYKTTLDYSGCGSCSGFTYGNSFITSTPIIIDAGSSKIRSNIVSQTHTYGLSINYSVQCNFDGWLCNISNLLSLALLYKAGEEIMNYAVLSSDRNNSNANIDYERNTERRDYFKTLYTEQMNTALKGLILPKNDICFSCNQVMRSTIILP